MPRQIVIESPEPEVTECDVASAKTSMETPVTSGQILTPGVDNILITSDEIVKLYNEWDLTGKNDLFINPSLAERIRQYLKYQEELDPLKTQLAERIYKPFIVTSFGKGNYKNFDILVNGKLVAETRNYLYEGYYKIIHVSAFKSILAFIQNPYAPYIDASAEQYVDFQAYVIANNGSYKFESYQDAWSITL